MLKGLAADGGLFLPEEIPVVPDWVCTIAEQQPAPNSSFVIFNVVFKAIYMLNG